MTDSFLAKVKIEYRGMQTRGLSCFYPLCYVIFGYSNVLDSLNKANENSRIVNCRISTNC